MITARELRISNLVIYNGLRCIVTGINSPAPRNDRFSDKYTVDVYMGDGSFTVTIDELKPVTIIQYRLESEGFRYVKPRRGIYAAFVKDGMRIEVSNSGNYYFKKRVLTGMHQVQNIYFELTGKEL